MLMSINRQDHCPHIARLGNDQFQHRLHVQVNRPETELHLLRADLPGADRVDAGTDRLT
jgi:hypothetical protein